MTEELLDMVEQKVYISVFDETVTGINESIGGLESSKLDKTTYNTDIPVIREDITDLENSKVDNTTFNDTVESINTSIGELDTNKTVTITKQATADTGYFSTYVINQGGTALSPKINIPKDYLLKSASLKQCTVKDEPIEVVTCTEEQLMRGFLAHPQELVQTISQNSSYMEEVQKFLENNGFEVLEDNTETLLE